MQKQEAPAPFFERMPTALVSSTHLEGLIMNALLPASAKRGSNSTPLNTGLFGCSHSPRNTGDKFKGTVILDDDALAVPSVTPSTEGSAIEFAISGGVVDGNDAVVNEPMQLYFGYLPLRADQNTDNFFNASRLLPPVSTICN